MDIQEKRLKEFNEIEKKQDKITAIQRLAQKAFIRGREEAIIATKEFLNN